MTARVSPEMAMMRGRRRPKTPHYARLPIASRQWRARCRARAAPRRKRARFDARMSMACHLPSPFLSSNARARLMLFLYRAYFAKTMRDADYRHFDAEVSRCRGYHAYTDIRGLPMRGADRRALTSPRSSIDYAALGRFYDARTPLPALRHRDIGCIVEAPHRRLQVDRV